MTKVRAIVGAAVFGLVASVAGGIATWLHSNTPGADLALYVAAASLGWAFVCMVASTGLDP